ncbi:MAG: Rrf2 family transcriptional regulator [Eubacterium sp.]|nr:Rrf2 family transcriptional regulator [Eubacterium sp.]
MHITLQTDYAIRIVDFMFSGGEGERFDAKTISESTDVPPNFALKILRRLAAGGIVTSYKGIKGGYELFCDKDTLSVYDVVTAMEGTYKFSRCLDEHYSCTRTENELPCSYQRAFARISQNVCEELKKLKFKEMHMR